MVQRQTQADGESSRATKLNEHNCPSCDSLALEDSFDPIDAVCSCCGYAIQNLKAPNPDPPPHIEPQPNTSKEEKGESWPEVCTITNSTEQRVASAFETVENLADELELSTGCRKQAAEMLGSAYKNDRIDGRQSECVVGCILYLAARSTGEPRPQSMFAESLPIEEETLDRLSRKLREELDLECYYCPPEDYIPYLARELNCTEQAAERAHQLVETAHETDIIDGKNPAGLAGAALYASESHNLTQRCVADVAGVSRETIRIRIKEFRENGVIL